MAAKGARKWIVVGCLGLIVVAIGTVGAVVGMAWLAVRSEQPVDQVLAYELPGADRGPAPEGAGSVTSGRGTVIVSMGGGEFYIEPGEPGESLNIEAIYDDRFYELEESIEGEERWTYEIRFRLTRSALVTGIKEMIGGSQPRIRLRLPPDVPIDLELEVKNGTANVDLAGLWVTSADFNVNQALLDLEADTPLHQPMDRITIRGRSGGLLLDSVSNMSPREFDIDFTMGGAVIDLRGQWLNDSTIDMHASMSDTVLRLPRNAFIQGLETTRPPLPTSPETTPPTLTFNIETGTRGKIRLFE